jgi:hypothetical protein
MGTLYLDAGYEALFFYRKVEDEVCHQKAVSVLGGNLAAQFITPNDETGGRAPDLLVLNHSLSILGSLNARASASASRRVKKDASRK